MMQYQSQDETGYLEIEAGGSVFFRDREGRERYFEWEELDGEVQDYLSRFVEDAEEAFDEALITLSDVESEDIVYDGEDSDDD
jgi:hypothetical protein